MSNAKSIDKGTATQSPKSCLENLLMDCSQKDLPSGITYSKKIESYGIFTLRELCP